MKRATGWALGAAALIALGFAASVALSDDGSDVGSRAEEQASSNESTSQTDTTAPSGSSTSEEGSSSVSQAQDSPSTPEQAVRDRLDEPAPVHVMATAGPVAEDASYVLVTWDHAVSAADHYEVERDGAVIDDVEVDTETWDDTLYRDERVPAGLHTYRVRAVISGDAQTWSSPIQVRVRSTEEIGAVYEVDGYQGSDLRRAQQAVDAAESAGGGVVLFGPRTYVLDDPLQIVGDGVLLRGAGQASTIIKVGFAGGDESCGRVTPLLLFRGTLDEVGATLSEPAARGDTTLTLSRSGVVSVGDVIEVDGVVGQLTTGEYARRGISQDPTIPLDHRYPFEAGAVVAVDGRTIELDHPLSQDLTVGAVAARYEHGHRNGIELLSVEGVSAADLGYHRLVDARDQVDFRIADVAARYANRNFMDVSGHHLTLIGFEGIEGGAGGYELEACKYKVGFGPATDVEVIASTFGSPDHDLNMSLLTLQFTYRAVVRNSTFGGSRTYGFNEHGGGSRDLIFENNYVSAGMNGWAGVLLGNDTWGFGGETAIRNNRFLNNVNDVLMVEHPYGVGIVKNQSSGCSGPCIIWSGWGDQRDGLQAIADPALFGSAKILIAGNVIDRASAGVVLGAGDSVAFPWEGIRNAVVFGNRIDATGPSITIVGEDENSGLLWVTGNHLSGGVERRSGDQTNGAVAPLPGDWWFWDNDQGPTTSAEDFPDWVDAYQTWERDPVLRRWNQ